MHCTSYQPISVANLGWSVNDVKPWYHRVYKICVFPRQPFTPWVRQWKRPFCAWVLPKITYNEITRQFIYCHYLLTSWCRFQWRRSAAARLLGLWVRIPQGAWMSVVILCVIRWKSLRRADPSSRGVLPTVMRRWVWSRNLVNEESLAHWGPMRQRKNVVMKQFVPNISKKYNVAQRHVITVSIWDEITPKC